MFRYGFVQSCNVSFSSQWAAVSLLLEEFASDCNRCRERDGICCMLFDSVL